MAMFAIDMLDHFDQNRHCRAPFLIESLRCTIKVDLSLNLQVVAHGKVPGRLPGPKIRDASVPPLATTP